jgi:hypothetical protein
MNETSESMLVAVLATMIASGFWDSRDTLLDNVVEVEADAVTQNQDGTYSLRFPRFVRFRGFEAGDKL